MSYIVGIDGGGTGCRVAIADLDGAVIGYGEAGPANATSDRSSTIANIRAALDTALAEAACDMGQCAQWVAHAGLAGVQRPQDADAIAAALPFGQCTVSEDRLTAMAGALGDDDGVLAAIGTGSFIGVQRKQHHRFFGGWGLPVSDQASGAWLGRSGLERALFVHDGLAEESDLTAALLTAFDGKATEIAAFAAKATPADFAQYAPQVIAAAHVDDAHGRAVVEAGAGYLRTCFDHADPDGVLPICLSGGIGPDYGRFLAPALQDRVVAPRGTALDGALQYARRAFLKRTAS